MRKPRVYWRCLRREWRRNGWETTDTGWLLTFVLLILIMWIGLWEDEHGAKVDQFVGLRPSEMGDTLAGLFSALAFIWIIVTVFIQGRELRETRVEVKHQRKASQEMAKAMSVQSSIFEAEQRERQSASLARLTDELIASLRWRVETTSIQWVGEGNGFSDKSFLDLYHISGRGDENLSNEQFFRRILAGLRIIEGEFEKFQVHVPISTHPKRCKLQLIYHDIKAVMKHIELLSLTDQTRLNRLGMTDLKEAMNTLLQKDGIWEKEN